MEGGVPNQPLQVPIPKLEISNRITLTSGGKNQYPILNNIELVRKLGSGQYGKVILGNDLIHKRQVAIKEISRYPKTKVLKRKTKKKSLTSAVSTTHNTVVNTHDNDNEYNNENKSTNNNDDDDDDDDDYRFPKRIKHEVEIMKVCDNLSTNVIKLFSVFNDSSFTNIYLVLEYCSLGEIKWIATENILKNSCKSIRELINIIKQIILGLEFLKIFHIIHRDIKPSNLLIDSKGHLKISDFGVSYLVDKNISICEQQKELYKTVGTPMFLPPELCTVKSDLHSINSSSESVNDSFIMNSSIIRQSQFLPISINGNENSSKAFTDEIENLDHIVEDDGPILLDYKLDIWSFGITIYCILFNSLPFVAEYEYELYNMISNSKIHYPNTSLLINQSVHSESTDELYFKKLVVLLQTSILVKHPSKRICIEDLKEDPLFNTDPNFITFNDRFRERNQRSRHNNDMVNEFNITKSRINSMKSIDSATSKNSTNVSSVTSKTLSAKSNSIQCNLNNSTNSSSLQMNNSNKPIKNSTSTSSISQLSDASTTTSKRSFGKLKKTFSRLKLLRSTSGSAMEENPQNPSKVPNAGTRLVSYPESMNRRMISSESKKSLSSINNNVDSPNNDHIITNNQYSSGHTTASSTFQIEKLAPMASLPDLPKPSFSRLLRKKSSQLLSLARFSSDADIIADDNFHFAKPEIHAPKNRSLSAKSSFSKLTKQLSTMRLVDKNDKLATPDEYKTFKVVELTNKTGKKNLMNVFKVNGMPSKLESKELDPQSHRIFNSSQESVNRMEDEDADAVSLNQTPTRVTYTNNTGRDHRKRSEDNQSLISSIDIQSHNNQSINSQEKIDAVFGKLDESHTFNAPIEKLNHNREESSDTFGHYVDNGDNLSDLDDPEFENTYHGVNTTNDPIPSAELKRSMYESGLLSDDEYFNDEKSVVHDNSFYQSTSAKPKHTIDFENLLKVKRYNEDSPEKLNNHYRSRSVLESDEEEDEDGFEDYDEENQYEYNNGYDPTNENRTIYAKNTMNNYLDNLNRH